MLINWRKERALGAALPGRYLSIRGLQMAIGRSSFVEPRATFAWVLLYCYLRRDQDQNQDEEPFDQ